jgi:acetolactate synthase-1/2/3 large subunit
MNLQELQTIVHYELPIKIFIQNNLGYGIIKQFQDAYFEGRHFATGQGYSVPDFRKIAEAYGIPYKAVTSEIELKALELPEGFCIIDMLLPPESLITPKTEMNRFIHDQFPYIKDDSISQLPYEYPEFPSQIKDIR